MDTSEITMKIEKLKKLIISANKNGNTGNEIRLILLSAKATLYLRNNDAEELKSVIEEIDEELKNNNNYN